MKRFRKAIVFIGLIVFLSDIVFSQEFGFDSTTKSTIGNPDTFVFTAGERLDGWWKLPIGSTGSVFEGSGHIGYTMNTGDNGFSGVPSGDIDRLRLAFIIKNPVINLKNLNIELGRLLFRDPTGYIITHSADGALLGFDYSFLKLSVQAGFTGLILRNSNGIALSLYDQKTSTDDSRLLGNSRMLIMTQIAFPKILNQEINLSLLAQQDLNPEPSFIPEWTIDKDIGIPPKGGKVDTQYSSLKFSGSLIKNLFYDASFTYGSGRTLSWLKDENSSSGYSYQYIPISSFLTGISFDYYVPKMLSSAFNFRFLFASGDADFKSSIEGNTAGYATQFSPLTGTSLGLVFSPKLSNLMVAELGGSVKPFEKERIQTGMKVLAFFRPSAGSLDVSGLESDSDASWVGFESDLFGNYRIKSDMGISLNTGFFFPGISPSGAFDKNTSVVKYSLQLALTLGL